MSCCRAGSVVQRLRVVAAHRKCFIRQKSHYETLGVERTASPKEIKEAFYSLSKKNHPDIVGAETKAFMDIREAYDALKDETSRRAESLKQRKRSYEYKPGDPIEETPRQVNYETIDLSSRYGHFYDPNQDVVNVKRDKKFTKIGVLVVIVIIGANICYIHYLFDKQHAPSPQV